MPTWEEYWGKGGINDQKVASGAGDAVKPKTTTPTPPSGGTAYSQGNNYGGYSSSSPTSVTQPAKAPVAPSGNNYQGNVQLPSWMGNMYSQVPGTNYYSTNPSNPNASKYYADGSPVASIGFDHTATGGSKFDGYGSAEQFKQIMEMVNSGGLQQAGGAQAMQKLMQGMLDSGTLVSNDSIYGGDAMKQAIARAAGNNTSSAAQGKSLTSSASVPANSNSVQGGGTLVPTTAPSNSARWNPDASSSDRLTYFSQNPAAAKQEISIVKSMYEAEKAKGASQSRLDQISAWADQVREKSNINWTDPTYGNSPNQPAGGGAGNTGVGTGSSFMQGLQQMLDAQKGNMKAGQDEEAKAREASLDFLKQFMAGNLEQQKAGLSADMNAQMTAVQKAYADAVASGNMGISDATNAYNSQLSEINKQAYENSQARNATGAARGIGNSQQFLGMEQTDAALANNAQNTASSERDQTVNALKQRIGTITTQRDLDVANIGSQYNSAVTSATALNNANLGKAYFDSAQQGIASNASANQAFSGQQFQAMLAGMTTEQQQSFQKEMAKMGYDMDISKMGIQQGYTVDNMIKQGEIQSAMQDKGFLQDIKKMGIQNGYAKELQASSAATQVALQKLSNANQMDMFNAKLGAEYAQDEKNYQRARDQELAKYTQGTPEYNIRKAQLDDAAQNNKQEIFNKAVNDVYMKQVLSDENFSSTKPEPYSNPAANILKNGGGYSDWTGAFGTIMGQLFGGDTFQEKQGKADKQQSSYKRYTDMLNGKITP